MKLRRYAIIFCLFLFAVSVIFVTSCGEQGPLEESPDAEDSAAMPDMSEAPGNKNLVDGNNISLADMEGQVLIVNFWATWCPPCRQEIPAFIELYDTYRDKNVTILGISLDDGEAVVKEFIEDVKINYPVIMNTRELQTEYEEALGHPIRSIPTTIIVDQEGEAASVHIGARPKSVFEQEILKLLAEG